MAVSFSWTRRQWEDLQPTPGRLNSSLRIVLATVISLLAFLILQMPFASVGLYFVFLVQRDSPSVSVRTGVVFLVVLAASIATELGLIILSDNDPVARILGVVVVTFIAGLFMLASTLPALASTWGFIFCTVIAIWETPAPPNAAVELSLRIVATVSIAVGASVAVEYVFGSRHPAEKLQEERHTRYEALEKMFSLYAQGAGAAEQAQASLKVIRLAALGQRPMQALYNQIVDRNLDSGDLPIGTRVRITMIAQLMDVAAAFGSQPFPADDPSLRRRCELIARDCHDLLMGVECVPRKHLQSGTGLLDRVEEILDIIRSMPLRSGSPEDKRLVALPSKEVPFLIPGALRSKDTVAFALKISLCSTLCYVFYHAVDWPGISTAVTTVLITGLSTTGAIKQKFAYRLMGSFIGGLVLGLGCTAFVFPYMDSITPLVVLVSAIAFLSAWWAAGRQFNYVGLQIAFSFYLVAFEGFSAPTELAPGRDRLIGILVALVVMWFVFDQIWPVRTVTAMRKALASVLRSETGFLRILETAGERERLLQRVDALRDQIGKTMADIRTMSVATEYEFGVDREQHVRTGQMIVHTGFTAVALFWNQLAVLQNDQDQDFLTDPGLIDMRRKLAAQMDSMAEAVAERKAFVPVDTAALVDPGRLHDPRYGEYVRNAVNRYGELQNLVSALGIAV
jgi:multidrug resistance protein MdtO